MVTLKHDGTRQFFMTIQSGTGNSRDVRFRDHAPPVYRDRNVPADDGHIERLPFSQWLGFRTRWTQLAENGTGGSRAGRQSGIVPDLNFISPSEIDAASTFVTQLELDVKLEIVEPEFTDQIRTRTFVEENLLLDSPALGTAPVSWNPAGQIPTIHQGAGIFPTGSSGRMKVGSPNSYPSHLRARSLGDALQSVVREPCREGEPFSGG